MTYLGSAVLTINGERISTTMWYVESSNKIIYTDRFGAVVYVER